MSLSATSPRTERARARAVVLVLAHAHLRMGALALARVELETLAGLDALDTIGQIDLAEVRWRTGDLLGAGEMATTALQGAEEDPVALIIASEAASALGRPSEARRLASLAIARAPDAIDAIFAGMPRSGVWPADAAEPAPTAPTLFDRGPENVVAPTEIGRAADDVAPGGQPAVTAVASLTLGFWDGDVVADPDAAVLPDPAREFEAGRTAMVSGALDQAGLHFGLALRLAPALAPAVLEVTDGSRSPSLMLVRGDAYRLAGHETEARRAYAVAAQGGLPERRQRVRVRSKARPTMPPIVESLEEPGSAADEAAHVADAPAAEADDTPSA
jgi:hypothetical protein